MEAGAVVVGEQACGEEAEALVHVLGSGIGCADFQGKGLGTSAAELVQDAFGEVGAQASSAEIGMNGQRVEAAGTTA